MTYDMIIFISNFLHIGVIKIRANNALSSSKAKEITSPDKGLLFTGDLTIICRRKNGHVTEIYLQGTLNKL